MLEPTPAAPVRSVDALPGARLASLLASAPAQPLVLRGLVAHWPVVQKARQATNSTQAVSDCLLSHFAGATVDAWRGGPEIGGRFFYNADFSGFNFERQRLRLDTVLDTLKQHADDPAPPAIYVGSTTVDTCLPGFRACHDLDLAPHDPLMSLWLGNRSLIAAHQDLPDNLACVAAGHRRFTLFPPDAVGDLSVGPIDLTPAGQPISLVDFRQPDLARHPRAAAALARAQVAELGPGDAIFIPSMWWHQIEALDNFNLLINCWWRDAPAWMDSPMNALMHALLSVRDLPAEQRQAWAALFDHYVFHAGPDTTAHIPPQARGLLAPLQPDMARQLRAQLLRKLNR